MTSVLSPGWDKAVVTEAPPLPEYARAEPAAVHHVLDGLAAFYASELSAREAARELQAVHGLGPDRFVLLAPTDVGRLRFGQLARRWNQRLAPQGHQLEAAMWTSAGKGALLGALLAALLFGLVDLVPMEMQWVAVLLTAVTGALTGAGVAAALVRQHPQFRKFDRVVRQRLAAGEWVLVVHDVPWKRQAGVVSLVSRHSLDWYGVSSERRQC